MSREGTTFFGLFCKRNRLIREGRLKRIHIINTKFAKDGRWIFDEAEGIPLSDGSYKLLLPARHQYNPFSDFWEFLPGSVVKCKDIIIRREYEEEEKKESKYFVAIQQIKPTHYTKEQLN